VPLLGNQIAVPKTEDKIVKEKKKENKGYK